MRVDDLTLEVRDRTLKRVGQITPAYLNLKAHTRWCGVGDWSLDLPGDHPMVPHLATPGSGVILLGPDGTDVQTILSGPTRNPFRKRNAQNPDGTYTFSGVTDEVILAGAVAFPDPSIADPQASSKSRSNDTRSGNTEALLRQFVAYNVANGALAGGVAWAPAGRLRGLREKVVLRGGASSRGIPQKKSPRFQNLLELLQEIVAYDPNYGFRMVQIGPRIEFEVLDARDRTKFVRFDVENGTITSEEVQSGGSTVTDAIVLGQGEGKDRQIVRRQLAPNTADETNWGLVFEVAIDQRDTDDVAELEQSGDEKLLEAQGGTSVKMVPADDTTMEVGRDWRLGDTVTTVVGTTETVARVSEVVYAADGRGVRAGAGLGDVSGFDKQDSQAATVKSLDTRVSQLERSGGLLPARLGVSLVGNSPSNNADDLIETGKYWLLPGASNTPDPTFNWEVRTTTALLSNGTLSVYQEAWRFLDTYGSDRYSRVRTAGVWSAWKVLGLRTRNFVPVSGVSTFVVGNGTIGGTYSVNDGLLAGIISVTLGTTSVITGDIQFELPMPYSGSTREAGVGRITDASTGANYNGAVLVNSSRLYVRPFGMTQAASGDGFLREYSASATRPITWEAGDGIVASFVYPIL
ncbi:minor tail protein [Microbacterium phage Sucha]|nr:minor tail protein [Microbacterium phage Sucha]